jgi:hypothetical protein
MALVPMINAKVNVRLDHTQLVALLLYLVHLAAQAKLLLQLVVRLSTPVSVLLATPTMAMVAVLHAQ